MNSDVILTVIIASYNASGTIRRCLESLAVQTVGSSLEVIVVDSSSDGTADLIAREFPWVRLMRFSHRKFCGDARNAGLSWARGRIIAFIDADCTAPENWAAAILQAHEQNPSPAIGGAIGNGTSEGLVGWAAYFSEFSDWMPGSPAGPRRDIAAANMSYKREVFDLLGHFISGTYCSDTEFHWRLAKNGTLLHFEPSIEVCHHSICTAGAFLRHEFNHGCSFARVRIRALKFSPVRRLAYAFLFGLIAAKLMVQIARRGARNAAYRKYFILSLPLTFLGVVDWSAGEAFGYLRPNNR